MKIERYWKIVWDMLEKSDVALEVVDARFPSICRSNRLENRIKEMNNCNLLIALNKADLVPSEYINNWIKWFERNEGIKAVGVSALSRINTSRIRKVILRQSKRKQAIVAVIGLPNTGKSSLINALSGRKAASTAPISGHTKGQQYVNISNSISMIDTPGIIPIKLPLKHQYLLGIIPLTKIKDPIKVTYMLLDQLEEIKPNIIYDTYGVSDYSILLREIAIQRNKLMKGGIPNEKEAALIFLKDYYRNNIKIHENIEKPLRFIDD